MDRCCRSSCMDYCEPYNPWFCEPCYPSRLNPCFRMPNFCDENQYSRLPNFTSRSGGCSWDFDVPSTSCCNDEAERLVNVMRHLETTNDRLKDLRRCHMENTGVYRALLSKVEKLESDVSKETKLFEKRCCNPCCSNAPCCGGEWEEGAKKEVRVKVVEEEEENVEELEEELELECEEGCPDDDGECVCCVQEKGKEEETEPMIGLASAKVTVDKSVEARPPTEMSDRAVGCDARCVGVDAHSPNCAYGCSRAVDKCVATCKALTATAAADKGTLVKPKCGRKGCMAGQKGGGGGGGGGCGEGAAGVGPKRQTASKKPCCGSCDCKQQQRQQPQQMAQIKSTASKACHNWNCPEKNKQREQQPQAQQRQSAVMDGNQQRSIKDEAGRQWGAGVGRLEASKRSRERGASPSTVSDAVSRATGARSSSAGRRNAEKNGNRDGNRDAAFGSNENRRKSCEKSNCCGKRRVDNNNNSHVARSNNNDGIVGRESRRPTNNGRMEEEEKKMLEFLWSKYNSIDKKLDACLKPKRYVSNNNNNNNNNTSERSNDIDEVGDGGLESERYDDLVWRVKQRRGDNDDDNDADDDGEDDEEGVEETPAERSIRRTKKKIREAKSFFKENAAAPGISGETKAVECQSGSIFEMGALSDGCAANDLVDGSANMSDGNGVHSVETLGAQVLRKLEVLSEEFRRLSVAEKFVETKMTAIGVQEEEEEEIKKEEEAEGKREVAKNKATDGLSEAKSREEKQKRKVALRNEQKMIEESNHHFKMASATKSQEEQINLAKSRIPGQRDGVEDGRPSERNHVVLPAPICQCGVEESTQGGKSSTRESRGGSSSTEFSIVALTSRRSSWIIPSAWSDVRMMQMGRRRESFDTSADHDGSF